MAGEPDSSARWPPGYPTEGDVAGARRFLSVCASTGDPQPFSTFEIRGCEDGHAIGGLGFHGPPDHNGSATIGYSLILSAQGKGYASEALRTLLTFAAQVSSHGSSLMSDNGMGRSLRRGPRLVLVRVVSCRRPWISGFLSILFPP